MKLRRLRLFQHISFRVLLAVLSFVAALYIVSELVDEVLVDQDHAFDQRVFALVRQLDAPRWELTMNFFTFFGYPEFLLPAFLTVLLILLLREQKRLALELLIMGGSSAGLLFGLKYLFRRERPDNAVLEHLATYSFPSGHALLTFVFCSLLIYLIAQSGMRAALAWTLSMFLVLFSLAVGLSRVVLQVHYATDVIAGFFIGYVWILIGLWARNRLEKKRRRRKRSVAAYPPPAMEP